MITVASNLLRTLFRVSVLTVIGTLAMADPVWAASAACSAVNMDWGDFFIENGETKGHPLDAYHGFESGETISYSATASGENNGDYATFLLFDGPDMYYASAALGDGHSDSGSVSVDQDSEIILFASTPLDVPGWISGYVKCETPLAPPSITAQPTAVTVAAGGNTTFSVVAENAASYQWQVDSGSGFTDLVDAAPYSGVTTATLAVTGANTEIDGHLYRAVVTGPGGSTNSNSAALVVTKAPAPPFTFAPPDGMLAEAMAGEDYRQSVTVTGATAPLLYGLASGALPDGMILNVSTGELTGPLAADAAVGNYSFTIGVKDANGDTGTASYTLAVVARAITVANKEIDVPTGSAPSNVYLNAGATGGPFTSAELVFVEPANAGTATIIQGEVAQAGPMTTPTGWYLKFTPDPAYSGQVRVGFRLTSALGVSNTGVVTYNLGYAPARVVQEIDTLVRGFVRTRQNLIAATIRVPGLLERRRTQAAGDPVTARMMPLADGITLGFSTSLAQTEAARNRAQGFTGTSISPFNIWIDGTFMAHNREQNGGRWGTFGLVSVGADYLLSGKALLGVSFHYDRMTDPTRQDAELTGNGRLIGPYASLELGEGVFWNTSLLHGSSSNTINTRFWDGSFDTHRWLFDTSITGRWSLDEATVLTPRLRAVYLSETVDGYGVENGNGDVLSIEGFTSEQLRASLGAEIARRFTLDDGLTFTPRVGGMAGFSELGGSGTFGSVSAGLSLASPDSWGIDAGLLFNIGTTGRTSVGTRIGFGGRF